MTSMYRVLRPLVYNNIRHELTRFPYGGIVFRLEDTGEHEFWVVASYCEHNTRFSMDIASRICDERAALARDNDPHNSNGKFALEPWDEMQHVLLDWFAKYEPKDDTPLELYRAHELNLIATVGRHIILNNEAQTARRDAAQITIDSTQIKDLYANIDNF